MTDLPVKPHRKTLQQTAIILNVSIKTVRRYLDNNKLAWSGNQVSIESIITYLNTATPKDEPLVDLPEKTVTPRRTIGRPRTGTSWVKDW